MTAVDAGIAWAEREAEAMVEPLSGPWRADDRDALPLCESTDPLDREDEAECINAAARARWLQLVAGS